MMKTKFKLIYGRPPFWRILKVFFPEYDPDGTIAVAFGRRIYTNNVIDQSFTVHEETHLIQQRYSYIVAVIWWIRYIASKEFRFSQELEAFRRQYKFIKTSKHYNHKLALENLGQALASPLYGKICTKHKAMELIK